MVVRKVIILILSIIFGNFNVLSSSSVFGLQRNESNILENTKNTLEFPNKFDEQKRFERNDDTEKVSYILNGFVENGTVPIDFPKDICLFELDGILHASVLHFALHPSETLNQKTLLTIFKKEDIGGFVVIFAYETKFAVDMDCLSMDGIAFVAISNRIEEDIINVNEGSPIFQVTGNNVVVAQYFSMPFQNSIYLRKHGNQLYFVQSIFSNLNKPSQCSIFRWSGYHFDLLDELPCTKATQIEPFTVNSDIYIAVAIYKDEFDESETFSLIYKFNVEHNRFLLHQKIRTKAAVDVKYFEIGDEQFIVFANSYGKMNDGGIDHEIESIIYKFIDDHFTPFQSIMLFDVIQFLPILGPRNEFILLISCKNQPTKAWQYNGWSFYKSEVQFTGGALGEGVSNMRNYLLEGAMAVVVANPYMLSENRNIFFPQFVLRKESNVLHQTIGNWCSKNNIGVHSIPDAKALAFEFEKLPKRNSPDVIDNINVQEISIGSITTKSLTSKNVVLDQRMADRMNSLDGIIEALYERIKNIEAKRPSKEEDNIFNTNDGREHFNQNLFQSEAQVVGQEKETSPIFSNKSFEFDELTIGETFNADFINGRPFNSLVFNHRDLEVSDVRVNELIINNYESYKETIGKANKNEEIIAESSSRFENIVVPESGVVDNVAVDSLVVDGLINGLDLATIDRFALKIRGDQVIESEMKIGVLNGVSLQTDSLISNKNIDDIVRTEGGPFTVDRTVQFAAPVRVNELIVNQRINNINVINGKFDILLKRANYDQVIAGLKTFDEVKLESPIVLQGKITKSNLNEINPIISITQDVELEGDYEITGNTTIVRMLRGENIFGMSGFYNVKDLLLDGLTLDTPVIEPIFEFVQPIKTTNLISKSVNNVDVSKFVRAEDIQSVYGTKSFTGDLHITNGYCEAKVINGVNLSNLNETIMKKSGQQIIQGKIHFNSIKAHRTTAKTISLFGHKLDDFLTTTDQVIPGNVTINGNLIVNDIKIVNLQTDNKVCGFDLGSLIADTITTTMNSPNSIVTGVKFFSNHLTLNNAHVKGNVFQLGTMESIRGYLNVLTEDVVLKGPITFNDLNVDKLVFTQHMNDISRADFGKQWMLSETDQNFTEPQLVQTINTVEDVILRGSFNRLELEKQFELTQFKDQPITFRSATFAQAIFLQPITLGGLVSGIKFPNDVVLRDADFPQSLSDYVVFKDLNVSGSVSLGKLNNIDYNIACDLIPQEGSSYGLILTRDAKFNYVPQIKNINGLNVNQLYNEAWLTNTNCELTGSPTLVEVEFTKPIEIKGLFNGRDVGYIAGHYVSLTKSEDIYSTVNIQGNVLYQQNIRAESIHVDGIIKDFKSGSTIKIEDFNSTVLKQNNVQYITGQWHIMEAHMYGDLTCLVNGLDLARDVVRYSNPINNVTASKSFGSIAVDNLSCQNGCKMMNVDVGQWIGRVALNNGNYTIQGTTVIEAPVFYNNINVLGLVNNITFQPENILLKTLHQTINGNVHISNKYLNDNRIWPLSFENVQLEMINGRSLSEFYRNVVYKNDPLATVSTRLEFQEPLIVDSLELFSDFDGVYVNDLINEMQLYQNATNYSKHLEFMRQIGDGIVKSLKTKLGYLDSYRMKQVIFGNIKKIVSVEVKTAAVRFDVFVMLNVTDINGFLNFYTFDSKSSHLMLDNELFGYKTMYMHILDIFTVVINDIDFLVVQTSNDYSGAMKHSFFTHFNGQFRNVYEMHSNVSTEIVELNMGTDDCFIRYARRRTNAAIYCAFFERPGVLGFRQIDEFRSSVGIVQIYSVTSPNRVEIAVLEMDGKICIWSMDQHRKFVRSQIIKTLHTTTHITMVHHNNFHYIAACSETIHSGIHLGSVEIYKSSPIKYVNIQSIVIESPTRAELSVVSPTNDLVLYVLTDSIAKPLIVYRYTGITKFKEFTTGVTLPRVQRLNILKAKVRRTELIAIISEGASLTIIEANIK